jgi:hypothetical protein
MDSSHFKLAGKGAVVTGAFEDIGAAIAKRLAAHGAAVVVKHAASKQRARLTDGARALGTTIAKRLEAWLRAWAHPSSAGFLPVCLRPGWVGLAVMPPVPSAGVGPLLHSVAAPLVRACPEGPPARHQTVGRRAALRPATLRPSRLRSRRAPLETREINRVSEAALPRRNRRYHDAVGQS